MSLSYSLELSFAYICHSIFRIIQLILALTVCGLYGINLSNNDAWQSRWIFAEVTAGLSAITALLYLIPYTLRIPYVFVWDALLFLLWISVFGVFASMYMNIDPHGHRSLQRMKDAVWIDLANAVCWFISATGLCITWLFRKRKSTFTGRANV